MNAAGTGPSDPPQSTRLAVLVPFGIVTLIWGWIGLVIRGQLGLVPGLVGDVPLHGRRRG